MKILVTGSRRWTDRRHVCEVLDSLKREFGGFTLIQGGAPGVDRMADTWAAHTKGITSVTVRADWATFGHAAGPIRNSKMLVEWSPDLVIAFFVNETTDKGTRDCAIKAEKRGITVRKEVQGTRNEEVKT